MPKFKELSSFPIAKNKEIVLSENDQQELVMAQRVIHRDESGTQKIFLKGAIIVGKPNIPEAKAAFEKAFENFLTKV